MVKRSKKRKNISLEDLRKNFHNTSKVASENLGISITQLKRICRDYNIPRWPGRRLKSLSRKIKKHESKMNALKGKAKLEKVLAIQALKNQMKMIENDPKRVLDSSAYQDDLQFLQGKNCSSFTLPKFKIKTKNVINTGFKQKNVQTKAKRSFFPSLKGMKIKKRSNCKEKETKPIPQFTPKRVVNKPSTEEEILSKIEEGEQLFSPFSNKSDPFDDNENDDNGNRDDEFPFSFKFSLNLEDDVNQLKLDEFEINSPKKMWNYEEEALFKRDETYENVINNPFFSTDFEFPELN